MSDLGKIIPLTTEEKELYSKLDFKYFLVQNIKNEKICHENIKLINEGYEITQKKIEAAKKKNKYQYHLFIEGYVRKMHSGGMLACHFNLSEARSISIIEFKDYGENWAYFEAWAKREKITRRRKIIWKRVVEIGALLGFMLAANQLIHIFKH